VTCRWSPRPGEVSTDREPVHQQRGRLSRDRKWERPPTGESGAVLGFGSGGVEPNRTR
jgi:hypothetical protein